MDSLARKIGPETLRYIKKWPNFGQLPSKQRRFILAYVQCADIQVAAKHAHCSWIMHYYWKNHSEIYVQAFEYAKDILADFAECDVFNRAYVEGNERTVTKVGGDGKTMYIETNKSKSDLLAMFMLKGQRPQYRDNYQSQVFNGPIQINIGYRALPPADDHLANEGQQAEQPKIDKK